MKYEMKRLEMEKRKLKHKQEPRHWIFWIFPHWKVRKMQKEKNIVHNNQMTDPNIALDKQYEN